MSDFMTIGDNSIPSTDSIVMGADGVLSVQREVVPVVTDLPATTTTPAINTNAPPATPAITTQENLAKKELVKAEKAIIRGDAVVFPNPRLRSGKNVKLNGLGSKLSGEYYIEKITYEINADGLSQTLTVRSNAIGGFFKGSSNVKEITSDREAL